MSYDNAEPKTLKTLNSNGQVLDDSGNVISDTTDYWEKVYDQTEPKPDKILHSDGTIKDSAGNIIQDSTEFNVKKYNQAEAIPAKYLHSDGSIDENPGSGSGADLEDNKTATIDVSTYTEPVEIEPSEGKDGMKKATVTLSNIPGGGSATAYAWINGGTNNVEYFSFNIPPSNNEEFENGKTLSFDQPYIIVMSFAELFNALEYNPISENSFRGIKKGDKTVTTYTRDSSKDFTLWG